MSTDYSHVLSPVKVGNTVLRNRLTAAPSKPHLIQGPEPYPTEGLITHYANKAKGGAALVTCSGFNVLLTPPRLHMTSFDIDDIFNWHYFAQIADAIHFYGGKAGMHITPRIPAGYDASVTTGPVFAGDVANAPIFKADEVHPAEPKEMPESMMLEIADGFAEQAALAKDCGFDAVYLHMAYRRMLPSRFLSPLTNKRTDAYGGSLENRARYPLLICDRIKRACGEDMLIEVSISASDPSPEGWTLEDTIEFTTMAEGRIDILQLRTSEQDWNHPSGFDKEAQPFIDMAGVVSEGIRSRGGKVLVETVGGYFHPAVSDEVIATGKADLIAMARPWISNPDYGRLLYEDRAEDLVPCVRCNRCHGGARGPWVDVCTVNPVFGLEHKIDRMIAPPKEKKRVAVVGGGPAGMEASLVAARRGHDVTLYEKSDALGGLLKTTEVVSFKWPVRDFKNYLVDQVARSGVDVRLNTEVSADYIKEQAFDEVLIAVGSQPSLPPIPGIDGPNVVPVTEVYGKEDQLAESVVVVGGGEVGMETGMHLAEKGHHVTVLEMRSMLAPDAWPIHYYTMFRAAWEALPNFRGLVNARCTAISDTGVTYVDEEGNEHTLQAGSVVIAAGMKARSAEAMGYLEGGGSAHMIGDCVEAADIHQAMRSAFSIASTL